MTDQTTFNAPHLWKKRSRLGFLLMTIVFVGVLVGVSCGWFRRAVHIRPAGPSDPVVKVYLGSRGNIQRSAEGGRLLKSKNLVVASGRFYKRTRFVVTQYLVTNNSARRLSRGVFGRSSARISGSIIGENLEITVGLAEYDSRRGRITVLNVSGHSAGAGGQSSVAHHVQPEVARTVPGKVTRRRSHIAYIEGDREPIFSRNMSLEEFSEQNFGEYLVIVVELQ